MFPSDKEALPGISLETYYCAHQVLGPCPRRAQSLANQVYMIQISFSEWAFLPELLRVQQYTLKVK